MANLTVGIFTSSLLIYTVCDDQRRSLCQLESRHSVQQTETGKLRATKAKRCVSICLRARLLLNKPYFVIEEVNKLQIIFIGDFVIVNISVGVCFIVSYIVGLNGAALGRGQEVRM